MNKFFLLLLSVIISGCASAKYSKLGSTNQDLQKDHNDCIVKAGQAGFYGGGFSSNMQRKRFINQCMEGQGWSVD